MSNTIKTETVEEYLARGGKITVAEPGPDKYDHSAKYRKDKQLKALRQLKKVVKDEKSLEQIESAIWSRIEILKVTF